MAGGELAHWGTLPFPTRGSAGYCLVAKVCAVYTHLVRHVMNLHQKLYHFLKTYSRED